MPKRKLIKIIFHAFILASSILPLFYYLEQFPENPMYFRRVLFLSLVLIPFYVLNIFYLVFVFLKRGKYITYVVLIFIALVFFGLIANFLISSQRTSKYDWSFRRSRRISYVNLPDSGLKINSNQGRRRSTFPYFILPLLIINALGNSFEIIMDWDQQRRRNKEIEIERISAELMFLKSQMNPHFIFNTLNNIYSLAAVKSDDTEKAILLLSNMMRYILYESGADKIPLRKEIQLLEDYIALQKLRLPNHRNIQIEFEYDIALSSLLLEPMLLLPLVENAFKHGISYHEKSLIRIQIQKEASTLQFRVENTKPKLKSREKSEQESGGIGLNNIQKRLQLSYPKNHYLTIEESENRFKVNLSLNLFPL